MESREMRQPGDPVFVVKANGEKVVGKHVSIPGTLNDNYHWIKLDGQKYNISELQSYQNKDKYCVRYQNVWAAQVKRGKISLYWFLTYSTRSDFSGRMQVTNSIHYAFQKGDGPLQELSREAVSEWLSDNLEAKARFDATFRPGEKHHFILLSQHDKVLFEIIDMYNNS